VPKVGTEPIRRQQILDAAFKNIAEHSLEGTRMRSIAKTARVSQPSLHYYFDSKDGLIVALLDRLLAEFGAARDKGLAAAAGPQAKLHALLEVQRQLVAESPEILEVYYDFWVQATKKSRIRRQMKRMQAHWRQVIGEILAEGVQQGVYRSDRVEMVPALIASILHGAALQHVIDPEDFDLDRYFELAERWLVSLIGVVPDATGAA
jgi:AcrR family transcriptional regulator